MTEQVDLDALIAEAMKAQRELDAQPCPTCARSSAWAEPKAR